MSQSRTLGTTSAWQEIRSHVQSTRCGRVSLLYSKIQTSVECSSHGKLLGLISGPTYFFANCSGRCRHWPGPHLDENRPDLADGGLVRAEVGPFRPLFYNARMAQKNAKNAARDVAAVSDLYPFPKF